MGFKRYKSLVLFLALVFLIMFLSHIFTFKSVGSWYQDLYKPSWIPPPWLFGPVWTILYMTIGVSGWLVFNKAQSYPERKAAFFIFGLQLICNMMWSFFFFFLQNTFLGLIDVIALLGMICWNIVLFVKIYTPAGILLIPYLIWTLFAAVLNYSIWRLNQ